MAIQTDIVVRTMRPHEFITVRAMEVAAFGGTPVIGSLLDALHASWCWEDQLSFVAERHGQVVGHVLYSHAILDAPSRLVDVLVLGPIGVRPDLQRSGIGRRLVRDSLATVSRRKEPLVFLEGDPDYYPQFGFRQAGELGFIAPSTRIPPAAFMAFQLPAYEPWMTGTLVYPDAFWRVDAVGLRERQG